METKKNVERTVLVVEDEETLRVLLVRAFVGRGFQIDSASSYREGLSRVEQKEFDLLVIDKNLPGGSGLDIIERSQILGRKTESILITGYSDTHSRARSAELNIFRYLRKPFDLEELQIDVDRALEFGDLKKKLATRQEELRVIKSNFGKAAKNHKESEKKSNAEEHLATMGSLSAGVCYELSTPMSLLSMAIPHTISEAGEMLTEVEKNETMGEDLSERIARLVDVMGPTQDAVNSLIRLCSDLNCISLQPEQEILPISLSDALNTALRLSRHTFPKGTIVSLEVASEIRIRGIESRLVLALINIIRRVSENLNEMETSVPQLKIEARAAGNHVSVTISHSGHGTTQDQAEHMFDQAFLNMQTSPNQEDNEQSGLHLVKDIIEEHGGTVYASSQPGNGIQYTIQFDLLSASIVPLPAVLPLSTYDSVHDRRKILFFDTEPNNLQIYRSTFGAIHDVVIAKSADEAQRIIKADANQLDAIVCELPTTKNLGTTGTEIQVLALAFAEHKDLRERVIFLADPGSDLEQARKDGFRILVKPARLSWLLSEIYRIPRPHIKNKKTGKEETLT